MTRFQRVVLSILGLGACVVFLGLTIILSFLYLLPQRTAQQPSPEKVPTQAETADRLEATEMITSIGAEATNKPPALPTFEPPPEPSASTAAEQGPGFIYDLTLNPEGKILAVLSSTGVRFYDMENFALMNLLEAYRETATGVAWSPDGKKIALGDVDGTVHVLDITTGSELNNREGVIPVSKLAWASKGNQIVIGYGDKIWRVWDTVSGKEREYAGKHLLEGIAWSPDGRQFVTANFDGTVRIWDAITGAEVRVIPAYDQLATDVAWSPDGTQIATGGLGKPIRLWDAATGEELSTSPNQFFEAADVDWSPDGQWLAAARLTSTDESDDPAVVRIWNLTTGESMPILEKQTETGRSVEWVPNRQQLIIGAEGAIWIWDMDNKAARQVITGYKKLAIE